MYYLIYNKKNDRFYGWTDSKELLKIFIKINKNKYTYIKTKTLLEPEMSKYDLYINNYQLDAYFQGQTDYDRYPLILRSDEFGLLETSIYNSLFYLSLILDKFIPSIKYFRNDKDEKQMMRSSCIILNDRINETISDDEPIYSDIINILDYYEKIGIKEINNVYESCND